MSFIPTLFPLLLVLPLLIVERLAMHRSGKKLAWREALASLGVFFGQSLAKMASSALVLTFLTGGHPSWDMSQPLSWLVLFIALEFCYYWMHRASHRIRWFWTAHSVHHSANQMNYAAGLRLGWTGSLIGIPIFFLPLSLMGFPIPAIVGMLAINLSYQFFLHTEMDERASRWFEYLFNTPEHHCVHHASNDLYLDKNYGGVLIIFDRLFGTFQAKEEKTEIRYGLTKPQTSLNPFVIALSETFAMGTDVVKAKKLGEKIQAVVGPPR